MKLYIKLFWAVVLISSSASMYGDSNMYNDMKACIEQISQKYGSPKFTFIISSDPSVMMNQIDILHLANIHEDIASKEAVLRELSHAIELQKALLNDINFSLSKIQDRLNQ